jgi:hypothetical protein
VGAAHGDHVLTRRPSFAPRRCRCSTTAISAPAVHLHRGGRDQRTQASTMRA